MAFRLVLNLDSVPNSSFAMCYNVIKIFHHKECDCNQDGSEGCMDDGNCICKENIIGVKCDYCKEGTYDFPNCLGTYITIGPNRV